jgi:predicted N-acetyltransferase YhbS
MNIRRANINDINAIAVLFDKYRVFYEKKSDINGAEVFLSERLQQNESVIFVAENDNNILTGFVQLYPIFSSTRMRKLWLLNDLFVDEKHRGKGISVLLINESKKLSIATNSCGLILETAKSNAIGNNLYISTAFTLDTEHNYYAWENN